MALNPQLSNASVPVGVGYSSGAGSGDRSSALKGQGTQATLQGFGTTLETLAGTADAVVKQKIYSDVNTEVDATRALFGADAATTASQSVVSPADMSNAKRDLAKLQNAYESGGLKASDYYARLNAQVKQLKNRYPGYEQEVDQIVASATGVNPANALVSALRSEAEQAASQADAAKSRWETYERQNQAEIERAFPGYFVMPDDKKPTPDQVQNGVARLKAQDSEISSLTSQLALKKAQKSLTDEELIDGARRVGAERSNQIVSGSFSSLGPDFKTIQMSLSKAMADPTNVPPEEQQQLQMSATQLLLTATSQIQMELSTGPFATLDPTKRNEIVQDAMRPIQAMVDAINNKDYGLLQATAALVKAKEDTAGLALIKDGGDVVERIMGIKSVLGPESFAVWLQYPENLSALSQALRLQTKADVAVGDPNVTLNNTVDTINATPGAPKDATQGIVLDAIGVITNMANPGTLAANTAKFLWGKGSENFVTKFKTEQQPNIFGTMFAPNVSTSMAEWAKENPQLWADYKKSAMVQFQQIARPIIDDINNFSPEYTGLIEVTFNASTGQLEARPVEGATIPGQIAGLEMIPQQSMLNKYKDLNKLLLSLKGIYDVEGKDFGRDVDAVLQTMGVRYSNPLSPDERQARPDLTKRQTSDINPTVNEMLSFVASLEAPGGFNQISGGAFKDLENMTIDEVLKMQGEMVASGTTPSSAVGGMQIIRRTLAGLKDKYGLSGKEFFSEQLQRQLGVALMEGRGLGDYLAGKIDAETFADNLAQEWAALPTSSGKSYYAGDGKNKALTDRATLMAQISKISGQTAMNFPGVDLSQWELDPELLSPDQIDLMTQTDAGDNYVNAPLQDPVPDPNAPPLDAKQG